MNKKLDLNELTTEQIEILIKAEKNPENAMDYRDILDQVFQSIIFTGQSYRCIVVDGKRSVRYQFQIHTTPVETIFSVGLMFEENHYHLLRLDFGDNLRHTNNIGRDNEYVVKGSHAHINSPSSKYVAKNVTPISELTEFANIKLIKDAVDEYLKYANIKSEVPKHEAKLST